MLATEDQDLVRIWHVGDTKICPITGQGEDHGTTEDDGRTGIYLWPGTTYRTCPRKSTNRAVKKTSQQSDSPVIASVAPGSYLA